MQAKYILGFNLKVQAKLQIRSVVLKFALCFFIFSSLGELRETYIQCWNNAPYFQVLNDFFLKRIILASQNSDHRRNSTMVLMASLVMKYFTRRFDLEQCSRGIMSNSKYYNLCGTSPCFVLIKEQCPHILKRLTIPFITTIVKDYTHLFKYI